MFSVNFSVRHWHGQTCESGATATGVKPHATGLIGTVMVTDQLNFIVNVLLNCNVFGSVVGCVIHETVNDTDPYTSLQYHMVHVDD